MLQARVKARESRKLLGQEPLVELLEAQTLLLEGDRTAARKKFSGMLDDDQTRLIALRGLHFEAEREGASEAARHYAEEASRQLPALPWAATALLRYQSREGDWEGALRTLEMVRSSGKIDKAEGARKRAVLLTAQAMELEPAHPERAAKLAKEANRLAPELVPAAIVGASAMVRHGDIRRAAKLLESVWKKHPHPEIAEAYVGLRSGDSVLDRLNRARKLAAMNPDSFEGNLAIAQAAIVAHDWGAARKAMEPVVAHGPSQRACMVMADIEDGQYGDRGRVRDWLARAVRAPRDPAWTADGRTSARWLPVSPLSGEIDAFRWMVPAEQMAGDAGAIFEPGELEALSRPLAEPVDLPETPDDHDMADGEEGGDKTIDIIAKPKENEAAKPALEPVPKTAPPDETGQKQETEAAEAGKKSEQETPGGKAEPAETKAGETAGKEMEKAVGKSAGKESGATEADGAEKEGDRIRDADGDADKDVDGDNVFPLNRLPDDPGIDDDNADEEKKTFKLF